MLQWPAVVSDIGGKLGISVMAVRHHNPAKTNPQLMGLEALLNGRRHDANDAISGWMMCYISYILWCYILLLVSTSTYHCVYLCLFCHIQLLNMGTSALIWHRCQGCHTRRRFRFCCEELRSFDWRRLFNPLGLLLSTSKTCACTCIPGIYLWSPWHDMTRYVTIDCIRNQCNMKLNSLITINHMIHVHHIKSSKCTRWALDRCK